MVDKNIHYSSQPEASERLDYFLVEQGAFASRAQAQAAIQDGLVTVNGKRVLKPAYKCKASDVITHQPAHPYVSRGGVKLAHGLAHFGFSAKGRHALDLGASTGGFTDVLLQAGAAHVVALDVGHGQLDTRLATDPHVTQKDKCNARYLTAQDLPPDYAISALVCDVSFISLTLALPAAMALAGAGCWMIALIKPQFEVGKEKLGKAGVVKDETLHHDICQRIEAFVQSQSGWQVVGITPSPVLGPKGNREFLLAAQKSH